VLFFFLSLISSPGSQEDIFKYLFEFIDDDGSGGAPL
jgi:hypothetical protein